MWSTDNDFIAKTTGQDKIIPKNDQLYKLLISSMSILV